MDPLQFAYKAKRGVEDATLTLMELVTHHLDQSGTFIRILLMDFSSAFNTLQTHLLLSRLLDLDVSPSIVLWVRAFLRDLTVKQKNRLNKIVNIATKLINLKQKSLNDLYQQAISKKSRSIINDPTHPLHSCFEIMPSGKRYRTPAFKRQLYNKSFIPSAVRFLNSQKIL